MDWGLAGGCKGREQPIKSPARDTFAFCPTVLERGIEKGGRRYTVKMRTYIYICPYESTENLSVLKQNGVIILAQNIWCPDAMSQDLYREKFKKNRIFPSRVLWNIFKILFVCFENILKHS